MKKMLMSMGVVVLAVALCAGCATSGGAAKGPSDADAVKALMDSWKAAVASKDVDKIMATISDSFAHKGYEYEAANKAALKDFIKESLQMGYLDNVEISFDDATTSIQGDTATVTGVQYATDQGTVTMDLTAKKANGAWLATDMAIQGM